MLSSVSTHWQKSQKPPVEQNQDSRMYFWSPLKICVIFNQVAKRKNLSQIPNLLPLIHIHETFMFELRKATQYSKSKNSHYSNTVQSIFPGKLYSGLAMYDMPLKKYSLNLPVAILILKRTIAMLKMRNSSSIQIQTENQLQHSWK